MCHRYSKARGDTIEDNVDEVVVCHASIDIEGVDFGKVLLNCTSLSKGYNLIVGFVGLVVVTIIYLNSLLNILPIIMPVPISFPLFQCISFTA